MPVTLQGGALGVHTDLGGTKTYLECVCGQMCWRPSLRQGFATCGLLRQCSQKCQEQGCGLRQGLLWPEPCLGEGIPWRTIESVSPGGRGSGDLHLLAELGVGWGMYPAQGVCSFQHGHFLEEGGLWSS